MKIKIKRVHPKAKVPKYMYPGDSGMDLYSIHSVHLFPGIPALVSTGLQIEIPVGFEGQIRPKSGLAMLQITVANTPGTIDSGYRGEVKVELLNFGLEVYTIPAEEKIAQLVICPVMYAEIEEVDELSFSPRGEGGFGSTGGK